MRYEFYDGEGSLLGLRENPEGRAMKKDEVITVHFNEQTVNWWKVIAVSPVKGGLQTVVIRPIESEYARP